MHGLFVFHKKCPKLIVCVLKLLSLSVFVFGMFSFLFRTDKSDFCILLLMFNVQYYLFVWRVIIPLFLKTRDVRNLFWSKTLGSVLYHWQDVVLHNKIGTYGFAFVCFCLYRKLFTAKHDRGDVVFLKPFSALAYV